MKVLYIAERINIPDGSAVHCRSFVEHVEALGHDILTLPRIEPLDLSSFERKSQKKNLFLHYASKINWRTLKYLLKRSNGYLAELVGLVEGL